VLVSVKSYADLEDAEETPLRKCMRENVVRVYRSDETRLLNHYWFI
jgi:hypothetical protein